MPDRTTLLPPPVRHCAGRFWSRRPARWRRARPGRYSPFRSKWFRARAPAAPFRTIPNAPGCRANDRDRVCCSWRKDRAVVPFCRGSGRHRRCPRTCVMVHQTAGRERCGMADFVTIEKGLGPEGRVAVVRFDRGDGINALSPEALRQLTTAARSFEDDASTSVVVLTGSARAFSAGFDLKDAEGRARKTMDIGALRRHLKLGPRLAQAWQDMEQITIAAIEGFCIGGGIALAVALDFRVMSRSAHIRIPEVGLGMNMSWQSVPRLLHLMGPARTKQAVILADRRISAEEAHAWRLVEEVTDPGAAFDKAMAFAEKFASQPPISAAMTKLTINRLTHALDDLTSHMDVDQFALATLTEDHKEGVAAFLERRKPRFRGR